MNESNSALSNGRRSPFSGFVGGAVLGVGLVVLIAVGWALGGGANGDPAVTHAAVEASAAPATTSPSGRSPHGETASDSSLDPEIEHLRDQLTADPAQLAARRKLALELLRDARFYAAFEEAARVLEQAPDDVDGLFVRGAVRVRMGQWSRALPLLERALEQAPDHIPALTAKGQALFKAGHANAAVTTWQRALELSGGENSQVEELLRQVPEGTAPGAESAATRNG